MGTFVTGGVLDAGVKPAVESGTMPRFMPVQCHKCSVLQMKPAQKLGLKWCCSMCRKPEIKVTPAAAASESHDVFSDVSLFVEELNLPQEAEEMGAVANTYRGAENLGGASNWEGVYYQSSKLQQQTTNEWKRVNSIEIYEEDSAKGGKGGEIGHKRGGSQQGDFLRSLWGRWHQKAAKKDVVELVEFAGGLGNEENVPPRL